VPEGNARVMADCLSSVLHNPELRARLGKRGVEVAREYAWTRVADQIEALYCEVTGERSR
jgi:glycosyltransferase involved in cell wall biosynthesis